MLARRSGRSFRSVCYTAFNLQFILTRYYYIETLVKEKYGSDAEDAPDETDDSEEDTTEDEEGEELTPAMDAAILRTLARIKGKDPAIYDTSKDVFEGLFKSPSYGG